MSLFSKIGSAITGSGSGSYDVASASLDPETLSQLQGDIGSLRSTATNDVTGLNASGRAATDMANKAYMGQLDKQGQQAGSQMATSMANVGRFGADSGSAERMGSNMGRTALQGQQQLGQANATNMANIAQSNLSQQESNKQQALMSLPGATSGLLNTQYTAANNAANAQNQSNLANMQAEQQGTSSLMNMAGSLGSAYMTGGMSGLFS